MAKEPDDRYFSAGDFARDAAAALRGMRDTAPPTIVATGEATPLVLADRRARARDPDRRRTPRSEVDVRPSPDATSAPAAADDATKLAAANATTPPSSRHQTTPPMRPPSGRRRLHRRPVPATTPRSTTPMRPSLRQRYLRRRPSRPRAAEPEPPRESMPPAPRARAAARAMPPATTEPEPPRETMPPVAPDEGGSEVIRPAGIAAAAAAASSEQARPSSPPSSHQAPPSIPPSVQQPPAINPAERAAAAAGSAAHLGGGRSVWPDRAAEEALASADLRGSRADRRRRDRGDRAGVRRRFLHAERGAVRQPPRSPCRPTESPATAPRPFT